MLVNSKEILQEAKKGRYAVPGPNFVDLDSARVFVQVAQKMKRPVILSFAQVLKDIISLEEAAVIGKLLAENAEVPVVLHLDHGEDVEYVKRAVDAGFTSVMIDASQCSFEENVRITKEVAIYAHERNVTVEAEIGHVGQGSNYKDYEHSDSVYTTAEEAMAFAEQTGVDSLAVSIGTAHGVYKDVSPVLNFERLHEISDKLPIPLVLHGGSGSGDDNLHRCAAEGISKINIFTDFLLAGMDGIREEQPKDYLALKKAVNAKMGSVLEHYYHIFSGDK
ncbi:class II fructose-bisphosphate aldolase [Ruminococcus gauvreauii]|uniref:Class II fructose-bisphosphate aldolase n=1 Tax=Ruminococcus gauvreauii TaxID=438033 RepID=A0ABY5VE36_9FIRM|nr:class II fructose-bisphosphate aldolase [Ruminococcus gauvreauii]UWP58810.1 class II fructose-bisphosphate aldolase [Ruminococcus gauvreauii]